MTTKQKNRRQWYLDNKDKALAYSKKYYNAHLEKRRKYQKEYWRRDPDKVRAMIQKNNRMPKGRYSRYKSGVKDRGISFNITFEEFMIFWQQLCYYCNGKIKTIGLDRKDPLKGYVLKNLVSCCSGCNYAKQSLTTSQFISLCKKIASHH